MQPYSFRIIIEPDDPTGYHGFVPLLPGVHTCGDSIEEVKSNLREAIKCHLQGILEDNETIPQANEVLESTETFSEAELVNN